ncbi:MAG: hypothetical protein ACKODB_02360 [Betaproteobacteria bacterium]
MNCPFCRLDVHPEAVICPHCHSLLGSIHPLAKRLDDLEAEVHALRRRLGPETGEAIVSPINAGAAALGVAPPGERSHPAPVWPEMRASRRIATICACILLLWALQALTLFAYDLPPVVFRVIALIAPFFVALSFHRRVRFETAGLAASSIVVAAIAVLLMLGLTAHVDSVPMWPETARDWRELFEFAIAIALGFSAGALTARYLDRPLPAPSGPSFLILLLTRDEKGRFNIEAVAERIQRFVCATAPLATGTLSVYSGLRTLVGGG